MLTDQVVTRLYESNLERAMSVCILIPAPIVYLRKQYQ